MSHGDFPVTPPPPIGYPRRRRAKFTRLLPSIVVLGIGQAIFGYGWAILSVVTGLFNIASKYINPPEGVDRLVFGDLSVWDFLIPFASTALDTSLLVGSAGVLIAMFAQWRMEERNAVR